MSKLRYASSQRSSQLAVVPAATWIIASIVAVEGFWIARTFESAGVVIPLALVTLLVVAIRLRTLSTSEALAANAIKIPLKSTHWLRPILLIVLFGSVFGLITLAERLSHHTGESISLLYLATDVIAHSAWLLTILMMVAWPRCGHPMMLPMGVTLALVTIAGGGISQSLNGQTSAAIAFCMVFVVASQTVGVAKSWWIARREPHAVATDIDSARGLKWLLSLAVLSIISTVTSTLANATHNALPDIQSSLHRGLRDSLDAVQVDSPLGSGQYVNGTQFGSVRRNLLRDPQGIALTVFSKSAPGYLRGNAFDIFADRSWMSADSFEARQGVKLVSDVHDHLVQPSGVGTTTPIGHTRRTLRHFEMKLPTVSAVPAVRKESNSPRMQTIEVHNVPMRGPVIFTPLSATWVEALSRQLRISEHSIIVGGVDTTEPYIAGVSERAASTALSAQMRQALLLVPSSLIETTDSIVKEELDDSMTAQLKAARLSNYFQQNYTYSLEAAGNSRRGDPVDSFLRTKHPAHCEYFATATAMLLRRAGVPTRYVTGYVVDEISSDLDYWIARNSDAHAWVEAYDDKTQTWFPVESTPGRSYQTLAFNLQLNNDGSGGAQGPSLDDDTGRSLLDRLIGWWVMLGSNDVVIVVLRFLQIPFLLAIGLLLWIRRRSIKHQFVDPVDRQSHKRLAHVNRRLKRYGLVRSPHETLHQFADRIEATAVGDQQQVYAVWYRNYAAARYQGQLPPVFGSPI